MSPWFSLPDLHATYGYHFTSVYVCACLRDRERHGAHASGTTGRSAPERGGGHARGRELQAQVDLNKAIADFHRIVGNTLQNYNINMKTDED